MVNLTSRQEIVSLQEAQFLLQSHEMRIDQLQTAMTVDCTNLNASANVAYNSHNYHGSCGTLSNRGQGRGSNGQGRGGRGYLGRGRSNYRPTCQICKRTGHLATTCYFRFDNDCQPPISPSNQDRGTPSSENSAGYGNSTAYLANSETINDPAWYVDSGATSHVTYELDNLSIRSDYKGKGKLYVGDGNPLTISNIGSSYIASNSHPLALHNILHVPKITKNLISVSQFTRDNDVIA